MYSGKSILFGAPINFGFSDAIKKELEQLGFKVYDVSNIMRSRFQYKSLCQRLHNFYRKVVFQDYEFKSKLRAQSYLQDLLHNLEFLPTCDFGLFIRPDFFPAEFLEKAKDKVDFMVAYQWDGFRRYPSIRSFVSLFDKFYAFDAEDVDYNETFPATNFYFPRDESGEKEPTNKTSYFVGTYDKTRIKQIAKLTDTIEQTGYKNDIFLFGSNGEERNNILKYGFHHLNSYMGYSENTKKVIEASLLIDIHNPIHQGLSFRTFESLGYNKKLITTNGEVKKYDFYNPNNIFVLEDHQGDDLVDFLHQPYQIADTYLKEKYSFANWVNYVFNLDNFIPIDLPTDIPELSYK